MLLHREMVVNFMCLLCWVIFFYSNDRARDGAKAQERALAYRGGG